MLVTSFGGQCRKKTAIFYECEGFSRRLRVPYEGSSLQQASKVSKILLREYKIQACKFQLA